MSIEDFERYPLTFGPSPIHPLDRLTAHLGGARIWAKREDCNSGLAYGGNKTRKLEYIVPDVLASGADTLVSIGGYQSNHTRQVAAVAANLQEQPGLQLRHLLLLPFEVQHPRGRFDVGALGERHDTELVRVLPPHEQRVTLPAHDRPLDLGILAGAVGDVRHERVGRRNRGRRSRSGRRFLP